ncbi:MAG TPA: 4Fe-4S binding protein [Acidobacteriota bacterium]|nr:4Fe-4S binding protein [Acidobacteriota bacterium]
MKRDQSYQIFWETFNVPSKLKEIIPKILSEDEANILSYLSDKKVTSSDIFLRFPYLPADILKSSFEKGYIIRHEEGDEKFYTSCSLEGIIKRFIIHSSTLNELTQKDMSIIQKYITSGALKEMKESKKPVYRVLPIDVTIEDKRQLVPFYQAKSYIQQSSKVAVVNCLCRATYRNCDKPLKVCLSLNQKAEFFIDRKIGEEIDVKQALEVLDIARQHDLIHSINNVENPEYLCNCCECCCVYIQGLKKFGIFTSIGKSAFAAKILNELCDMCGLCIEKCPFGAFSLENETMVIDEEKCFGCGLCSYHCPQSAIQLIMKKQDDLL